jgi:hypothetical protein
MATSETVICTFRVRADAVDAFGELLRRHWPTLRRLGLVTDTPEQLYLGGEHRSGEPVVVSIFEWVSREASDRAHDHPEVADIWEAMGELCESRGGMPSMDFPHFRPLVLT